MDNYLIPIFMFTCNVAVISGQGYGPGPLWPGLAPTPGPIRPPTQLPPVFPTLLTNPPLPTQSPPAFTFSTPAPTPGPFGTLSPAPPLTLAPQPPTPGGGGFIPILTFTPAPTSRPTLFPTFFPPLPTFPPINPTQPVIPSPAPTTIYYPPFQPGYGGGGIYRPTGGDISVTLSETSSQNVNMLTSYMANFLTSLTREQLIAFFRVFFLSQQLESDVLNATLSGIPLRRSLQFEERQAVETARNIPLSSVRIKDMEMSGLGQLIREYATKLNSAPNLRIPIIKDYYKTVGNLRVPKGIKYALKQAIL